MKSWRTQFLLVVMTAGISLLVLYHQLAPFFQHVPQNTALGYITQSSTLRTAPRRPDVPLRKGAETSPTVREHLPPRTQVPDHAPSPGVERRNYSELAVTNKTQTITDEKKIKSKYYPPPPPSEAVSSPKRLIILAYMRTGSSMTGSIFNNHPDVFYWFEPLHAQGAEETKKNFHMEKWTRRDLFRNGQEAAGNVSALLGCDIQAVYWKNMLDGFMAHGIATARFKQCFTDVLGNDLAPKRRGKRRTDQAVKHSSKESIDKAVKHSSKESIDKAVKHSSKESVDKAVKHSSKESIDKAVKHSSKEKSNQSLKHLSVAWQDCVDRMNKECRQSYSLVALKTIRLGMSRALDLLRADPGLRVLHLVRDPRAVLTSRARLGVSRVSELESEAAHICGTIAADVKLAVHNLTGPRRGDLHRRYMLVRYEDIARSPVIAARLMYRFAGLQPAREGLDWAANLARKAPGKRKPCSVCPAEASNSTARSLFWRREADIKDVRVVSRECSSLMTQLGYRVAFRDRAQLLDPAVQSVVQPRADVTVASSFIQDLGEDELP